jgi:hypothetical protein
MKQIVFIFLVMLSAVLVGVAFYNVWRGETDPLVTTPGPVEQGRMDLHAKLVQAEQREAGIEKTYWHSPEKLRVLIKSHRQRVDELNGNNAGAEIVAHDKDAIARLEKRVADLEVAQEAEAEAREEQAKVEARAKRAEALQKRSEQN